ncbi:hypothetical protein M9458_013295, partial [Cirrhinus mrigala]
ERATELRIAPELEPDLSEQMRELATVEATVDEAGEHEGLKESPAHSTTAGGELPVDSKDLKDFDLDLYVDMPILLPPPSDLSVCPEHSVCPVSAKEAIYELSVCPVATKSSASPWLISSPSPPWAPLSPASPPSVGPLESSALHPPWLLPLLPPPIINAVPSSPPWPVSPPAPPGSLVPPAPSWSSVTPALPQPSGSLLPPWSPETSTPLWPPGSSASLSSTMTPPFVGSTVDRLHGYGRYCLAPPAPSPSCLLLGSSFHPIDHGFFCRHPGSSLRLVRCGSSKSSASPWLIASLSP